MPFQTLNATGIDIYTVVKKSDPYAGFLLKSQNENSGLFQDVIYQKSAPTFTPFRASTYEFDTKTRHCETKPYCQ